MPASLPILLNAGPFRTAKTVSRVAHDHLIFILIISAFYSAGIAIRHYVLGEQATLILPYVLPFGILTCIFVILFLIGHALYVMVCVRPNNLTACIWRDLRDRFLTPGRISQGVIMLLLMHPFLATFTSLKTLIPIIQPFYLDNFFMVLDQTLHGGQAPWVWLQPLFGTPAVTFFLNILYNLWFFILFAIVFWQAFSQKDQTRRLRFFLTFLSLWIFLGVIAATALSSAGPVYYGRITVSSNPYQALMDYLHFANETYPIWSLKTQNMLWASYEHGIAMPGSGISAMPSLHVATTTLFALLGWNINRLLGSILTIYALGILLGSVHLGWHYAVDGYLSIALTGLIWWAIGKAIRTAEH